MTPNSRGSALLTSATLFWFEDANGWDFPSVLDSISTAGAPRTAETCENPLKTQFWGPFKNYKQSPTASSIRSLWSGSGVGGIVPREWERDVGGMGHCRWEWAGVGGLNWVRVWAVAGEGGRLVWDRVWDTISVSSPPKNMIYIWTDLIFNAGNISTSRIFLEIPDNLTMLGVQTLQDEFIELET
ncbi:hypothetical protein B0H14DRAFT_2638962 [Mycena olivaceomarginata]|nr:hypothetical protein B0H14DRAFT_2638962 [Mycena olivaceomarginata]